MSILAWIEDERQRKLAMSDAPLTLGEGGRGLWTRCDSCGVILYIKLLRENQYVCFSCGNHIIMSCSDRIHSLIDPGTWNPTYEFVSPCDPLRFHDQRDYKERLEDVQTKTGLQDAVLTGTGMLDGIPIALGVMDFRFMGGSMGSVVGEKITRLIEAATQAGIPAVLVCASGGARMQEGIFSLMQMAKVSAALYVHQVYARLMYIALLTAPTTGGVTASFAMLGDIVMAEPKALIGFAGRRVIQQTLMEELPDDFQTSEYLLYHGLLDMVVPRGYLRQALFELLIMHKEAPLRKSGYIPYGVHAGLSPMEEDLLRGQWANQEWASASEALLDGLEEELRTSLLDQVDEPTHRSYAADEALERSLEAAKQAETFWMADHTAYGHAGWIGYRPVITPLHEEAPGMMIETYPDFSDHLQVALDQDLDAIDDAFITVDVQEELAGLSESEQDRLADPIHARQHATARTDYEYHAEDYIARRERDLLSQEVEDAMYERGERGGTWMYTPRTYDEQMDESMKMMIEIHQLMQRDVERRRAGARRWESADQETGRVRPWHEVELIPAELYEEEAPEGANDA